MIPDVKVAEILALELMFGWSQRAISKATGASRGTVQAILHGRRSGSGEIFRFDQSHADRGDHAGDRHADPDGDRDETGSRSGPRSGRKGHIRCPECGFLVLLPCLACHLTKPKPRFAR